MGKRMPQGHNMIEWGPITEDMVENDRDMERVGKENGIEPA